MLKHGGWEKLVEALQRGREKRLQAGFLVRVCDGLYYFFGVT